jgi:hypothetical protein
MQGVVVHARNPSYLGGGGRRTAGQSKSVRPYLKNNQKQKDRGHGSSGVTLAQQE